MIRNYKGDLINDMNDWFSHAPPAQGIKHWVDGRSAKELAKSWFITGGAAIPQELKLLLESHPVTSGLQIEFAIPEMKTKLDDFRGGRRNHDLIIVGETMRGRALIAIEAKTDESFGKIISKYISEIKNPRSKVPDRINQLSSAIFGIRNTELIRYQLLHAVAGTLIEAKKQGATQAMFIVHEFVPKARKSNKAKQNEKDLSAFIELLTNGDHNLSKGKLIGPIYVHGDSKIPSAIPLYLGKVESILMK